MGAPQNFVQARCETLSVLESNDGNLAVAYQGTATGTRVAFGIRAPNGERKWYARKPLADSRASGALKTFKTRSNATPDKKAHYGNAWEQYAPCDAASANFLEAQQSSEFKPGKNLVNELSRIAEAFKK